MTIHLTENDLFRQLKKGDVYAFEKLFKAYYRNLCFFAESYVKEKAMAEEIVGNFFTNIWEKRYIIEIKGPVKSYFYTSIHNQCIKYLEHLKVMKRYRDYASARLRNIEMLAPASNPYPLANLISQEIVDDIEKSINELPEKCREVFCLSRFEEMSYEDISAKLNISVNTVRTQMARALQKLRDNLKDYLPLYIYIILNAFLNCYQ
ncbi:MAG: RNA polymerase sigma-70 factor [Bacteroidales bacterium]|nr:RNA polymerase sigma-70 factor [Bacteroidales bacterium]MBN2761652.1 RNA polymerase sigma-70 factor [Bacteroidales bacterium]